MEKTHCGRNHSRVQSSFVWAKLLGPSDLNFIQQCVQAYKNKRLNLGLTAGIDLEINNFLRLIKQFLNKNNVMLENKFSFKELEVLGRQNI